MFMVRCLQWTTVIERTFYADSAEARQRWIEEIEGISQRYKNQMNLEKQDEMMDTVGMRRRAETASFRRSFRHITSRLHWRTTASSPVLLTRLWDNHRLVTEIIRLLRI